MGQAHILGYPRIYVDLTWNVNAAIFLNQCVYWSDKGGRSDGYFYKSDIEWAKETGLSVNQIESIRNKLVKLGFIHTKLTRANGAPTTHYIVDIPFIEQSIKQFSEKQHMDITEINNSDLVKSDNSITEITKHNKQQNITEINFNLGSSVSDTGEESFNIEESSKGYDQHIDPDVLKDWEEQSKFPNAILEVTIATSLTIEEKEHLYKIEALLYDGEIDGVGRDEAHTWSTDKFERKYIESKLKWARTKLDEGKGLKPSYLITAIEKPENKETWRSYARKNARKANRNSPT